MNLQSELRKLINSMPLKLDNIDTALVKSLLRDGRKSFRQISREIGVSTPTVKARYERLRNVGLIEAVMPVLNLKLLEGGADRTKKFRALGPSMVKNMKVKVSCDYCGKLVHDEPSVLKFGEFERFFCCDSCRYLYKEKYKSRIRSFSKSRRK